MTNKRILIVEDELIAAEYLKEILEENGYEVVDIVTTGTSAIAAAKSLSLDLILMDIMLQDSISGSEAALQIKQFSDVKVLFLTAYADKEMVDYAVTANAAGYLMKPYNEVQIVTNLRLLFETERQSAVPAKDNGPDSPDVIRLKNGYTFHPDMGRVLHGGHEVELGPRALSCIALLCRHANVSVSNEQIAMHVYEELVNDKTLRSLVHRIRKVMGEEVIKNVNGVGYMIVSE